MMRELDTVSPVVWPAWCYSGGQTETEGSGVASADVLQPRLHPQPPSASSAASSSSTGSLSGSSGSLRPGGLGGLGGGASAHRKRRAHPRSYEVGAPGPLLNGSVDARRSTPPVKSERLSPSAASTSSRSGTPSSPPASLSAASHPAASPAASPSRNNNNSSINNNNISSHLKAMEDTVTHNYSEFMRNLAAKYQYVHPDEFYSATRNGFPAALDPRFPYKASAAPFVGLMPPLGPGVPGVPGVVSPLHHLAGPAPTPSGVSKDVSSRSARDREERERDAASGPGSAASNSNHSNDNKSSAKSPPSSAASAASVAAESPTSLFGAHFSTHPLFSGAVPPAAVPLSVMDMSSTQALVSMVQRSHQNQLETYLKGAIKRPAETSPLCPLDLSSAAPLVKKSKAKSASEGLYGMDSLLGLPSSLLRSSKERMATRRTGSVSPKPLSRSSSRVTTPAAPGSPQASSKCGDGSGSSCSADALSVSHWSVGDVCNFVGSIDLCVEYVQEFREQRIDGAALPLLTEEHLRGQMKMKLGPALKLRSVLAKRLGHCSVCLHCVHCHLNSAAAASGAGAAAGAGAGAQPASSTTPAPGATPSQGQSPGAVAGASASPGAPPAAVTPSPGAADAGSPRPPSASRPSSAGAGM